MAAGHRPLKLTSATNRPVLTGSTNKINSMFIAAKVMPVNRHNSAIPEDSKAVVSPSVATWLGMLDGKKRR